MNSVIKVSPTVIANDPNGKFYSGVAEYIMQVRHQRFSFSCHDISLFGYFSFRKSSIDIPATGGVLKSKIRTTRLLISKSMRVACTCTKFRNTAFEAK